MPNADLVSNALINYTHKDRHGRLEIKLGVDYGTDVRLVEKTLLEVARANRMVARWPEPCVVFMEFGDNGLLFELRVFMTNVDNVLTVQSDLNFAIEAAFREAGIDMPFQQQEIHWQDIDKLTDAIRCIGKSG